MEVAHKCALTQKGVLSVHAKQVMSWVKMERAVKVILTILSGIAKLD